MSNNRGLGRGLGSLIPGHNDNKGGLLEVDINSLEPNPYQPRQVFNEESLQELAESLRVQGMMQPIVVRKSNRGWQIVAGERRWRAARKANLAKVQVIVQQCDEQKMMEWALVENLQRENLNPLEEAQAYQNLISKFSLTQEDVASKVGKSRSAVANSVRLLNLPADIQLYLQQGKLNSGQARSLLALSSSDEMIKIANRIVEEQLSVRDVEQLIQQSTAMSTDEEKQVAEEKKDNYTDPYTRSIADRMTNILGTKVRIKAGKIRSKIEIEYYSSDDLQRIIECLEAGETVASREEKYSNFVV